MTPQNKAPNTRSPGVDPFVTLAREALSVPLALTESSLARCKTYVDTLLLWRQRLSLTAAKTVELIVFDHLLDSLHVVPFLKPGFRVADVGSGAGFPGIPLAIVCPDVSFLLLEPRRKRANFLREVARQTRLGNVEVQERRVEDLEVAGALDVVVARAVGSVHDLLALSARLVKPAGLVIAMKGPKGRKESAVHPAFAPAEIVEYRLPNGAMHLLLVHRRL